MNAHPRHLPNFVAIALLAVLAFFVAFTAVAPNVDASGAQTSLTAQQKAKAKAKARAEARKKARLLRGPAGLRFYTPSRPVPARHGTLIWSRAAGGNVPLPSASSTRLILYSSTSVTGKKVAVSGSVSIPKGKAPAGGWPVISYGHGTTGIADQCAPSRNTADGPADGYITYTDPILNDWLDQGYAVLRTDYEGLGTPGVHPFLVGKSSGRGILDIVRAARQLDKSLSKNFAIAGHSQGGHAALFAAGQASTWTPELSLKGTVAYAPASQLEKQLPALKGAGTPALTPLASMIVRGMDSVYPAIDANALLSDLILPLYPDTLSKCLSQLSAPDSLGGVNGQDILRSGADESALLSVLEEQNPLVRSAAPLVLPQGLADTTTLPGLTSLLVSELKKLPGNRVTELKYANINHGLILQAAKDDVNERLQAWFP